MTTFMISEKGRAAMRATLDPETECARLRTALAAATLAFEEIRAISVPASLNNVEMRRVHRAVIEAQARMNHINTSTELNILTDMQRLAEAYMRHDWGAAVPVLEKYGVRS